MSALELRIVALIETLLAEADKGVPTVTELIDIRERIVAAIREALSRGGIEQRTPLSS